MDPTDSPRYIPATDQRFDKGTLYRYMNSQWVDLFRNEGKLRVHMLKKYQDIGDKREDATENISTTLVSGSGYVSGEQAKAALGLDVASATFAPDWKGTLQLHKHLPNGYGVCTSATLGS